MMEAIFNSAMLDSDTAILDSGTLLSFLRFIQKHSHSTLTLPQTSSIWLTWWCQPSCILPSWILPPWIQPFSTKNLHSFILILLDDGSHLELCHHGSAILHKNTSLIHSDSTWWWQPSCILPSWILPPCIQPFSTKNLHSFILILLDDGSHLLFSILNSALLDLAILLKILTPTNSIWPKVIYSHSTWWWTAILNSAILDSAILHKKNFTYSFWLNLMMAAILNSANLNSTILDLAILVFPLKLTHTCQDWFPPFAQ